MSILYFHSNLNKASVKALKSNVPKNNVSILCLVYLFLYDIFILVQSLSVPSQIKVKQNVFPHHIQFADHMLKTKILFLMMYRPTYQSETCSNNVVLETCVAALSLVVH